MFASVLAGRGTGSALDLLLSTATRRCEDLRANNLAAAVDETLVFLRVAPDLSAAHKWSVVRSLFDGMGAGRSDGRVALSSAESDRVAGELAFRLEGARGRTGKPPLLAYDGPFDAKDCGPLSDPPPSRPQRELTWSVSDQRFQARGATLTPFGKRHKLVLSVDGHACSHGIAPDGDLSVTLDLEGEPPAVTAVWLSGNRIESRGSKTNDVALKLPGGVAKNDVPFEIEGKVEIAPWVVALSGKGSALRCAAPTAGP